MKKFISLFYLLVFVTVSIFMIISCEKSESEITILKNVELIKDIQKEYEDAGKYHTLSSGEILIRSTSNNEVAVFIVSPENNFTTLYLVQLEITENNQYSFDVENGQLLFLGESVIINDLSQPKLHLFTISNKVEFSGKYSTHLKGYGLSQIINFDLSTIKSGSSIDGIEARIRYETPIILDATCKCKKETLNPNDSNCSSGGIGASSCSVAGTSGCSVSCDTGYYACCS